MSNSSDTPILNQTQLEYFFQNGYLRIPHLVSADLLKKLRDLFDELMFQNVDDEPDKVVYFKNGERFVSNLDNLSNKGNLACLELLGNPKILEIAEIICGADFFSIQEFAVVKQFGGENHVLWHQDMLNQQTGNCFTMAIYVDDADEGDGALRVVPKSHLSGKNICELKNEPFIELPMKAGDVQIHDMMLAHSSEPLTKNQIRRVIYFEFLSATQVRNEQIYPEEYIQIRTELLKTAISFYRKFHPDEKPFDGKNHQFKDLPQIDDFKQTLDRIYQIHVKPQPSAYCFENLLM